MSTLLKCLYINGERSADYGLFITGAAVYNAASYDYEVVQIPGRNGDLVMDNGRFNNISVTYPAFVPDVRYLQDIRQWLSKHRGYQRITDDYNPAEFRMGMYIGGLEVDVFRNRAGTFSLTFNCKPQRFLTYGERTMVRDLMTLHPTNHEYSRTYTVYTAAELFDDEWAVGGDPDEWLPALKSVVGSNATKTRAQLISYLNSNTGGLDLKTAGCITASGSMETVQVIIDHSAPYNGNYRSMFHITTEDSIGGTVVFGNQGTHVRFYNPTDFTSNPLIRTNATALDQDAEVWLEGTFQIEIDTSYDAYAVYLDTDTWEAYSIISGDTYSRNAQVKMPFGYYMPSIPPGYSYWRAYLLSTDESPDAYIEVTPRWWII